MLKYCYMKELCDIFQSTKKKGVLRCAAELKSGSSETKNPVRLVK